MPSTATITAYYSFTANTKARATQVNTNFSNYRGHLIAIDPNTATAATTETYDLGSTEYRWRTGYFREVDLKSNTTTGQALQIVGDTAAGNGAYLLKRSTQVHARIGGGNQYIDHDTTTSQFDLKHSGVTSTSFRNGSFTLPKRTLFSVFTTGSGSSLFTATTEKLFGTLSVTSYGGNILLGLNLQTQANSFIQLAVNTTGFAGQMNLKIYRDNTATLIHWEQWRTDEKITTTAASPYKEQTSIGPWIDDSCTAGNHTYYIYAYTNVTSPAVTISFTNTKFQAIETV